MFSFFLQSFSLYLLFIVGVLVRFVDDEFDEDTPCTIGMLLISIN